MRFIMFFLITMNSGCLSGPQFLGKDYSSNSNDAKSESERATVDVMQETDGTIIGRFSATTVEPQNLGASNGSNISGANINIQPNSLAIDTNITIEEGAFIASDAVMAQLAGSDAFGVSAAANPVLISSEIPIDLLQPMTIQISIPVTSGLVVDDLPGLVVFYKIFKKSENRWVLGIMPRDQLTLVDGKVAFTCQYFGTFQAVILNDVPKKPVKEITIASQALSKKQENQLPEISWGEFSSSFKKDTREVIVTITATGHQEIDHCDVMADTDQLPPFDMRQRIAGQFAATFKISASEKNNLTFKWICSEKNGRISRTGWSKKIDILARDLTPPTDFSIANQPAATRDASMNISWSAANDAVTYRFALTSDRTCTNIVSQAENIISTIHTLTSPADGHYFLCLWATDEAGNIAAARNNGMAIRFDTTAPVAVLTGTPTVLSNVQRLAVQVAGPDVVTYRFKVGDSTTNCQTAAGYSSEIAVSTQIASNVSGLPETRVLLCVQGIDAVGNVQSLAAATQFSWTRDITPPAGFSIATTPTLINVSAPRINWTTSSGASFYKMIIDDNTDCGSAEQSYSNITVSNKKTGILNDGTHYACIYAVDAAGNSQAAANNPVTLNIDASWFPVSAVNRPSARREHSAIWTGTEMIVWGGLSGSESVTTNYLSDGARYNPATDQWTIISSTNAPDARAGHSAMWNGTHMIIWGGRSYASTSKISFVSGKSYNPADDTWSDITDAPYGLEGQTTVKAGDGKMMVWGGRKWKGGSYSYVNIPMIYDSSADYWTNGTTINAPYQRAGHTAVWSGTKMIVWGGGYGNIFSNIVQSGGIYDPVADSWSSTNITPAAGYSGAPTDRLDHTAVISDADMLVYGGCEIVVGNCKISVDAGVHKYSLPNDTWSSTVSTSAIAGRYRHKSLWTGSEMLVWGGRISSSSTTDSGGRYNPGTDSWTATPVNTFTASPREKHTMVWTGQRAIIFGGYDGTASLDSGAIYTP